ncbi:hypothetical protein [Leptothermofonsia sp. ETS-13]|uniref:hypothetical protein n=1 Tax=Leptothermofonsia sp. ETS-13 TaxID=3035696 RepID=UPI003BA2DBB0
MLLKAFHLLKAAIALPALSLVVLPITLNAVATSTSPPGKTLNLLPSLENPVLLAQRSRTQRIRFKPGESSASIRTAVVRGTRDIYLLRAQKGQIMTVKIESLENNALFDVAAPLNQSGQRRVLKQETMVWSGKLPDTGDYQIAVGTIRGNATYKLWVEIR